MKSIQPPANNVVPIGISAAKAAKSVTLKDGEVKMSLRCVFTEKELLEQSKKLAEANRKVVSLSDDAKRVANEYKSRISTAELDVSVLSEKVTTGYEYRDVACRVRYDHPKAGKKTIIRTDINEEVGVHDMNNEEKQLKLSLQSDAQGDGASAKTIDA